MRHTRLAPLVAALALPTLGSACVVVDSQPPPPPPDPYGDIAFNWSFGGVRDCDVAGVDEVDIAIFQGGVLFDEIQGEPCVGGGLILTDYFNDVYELEIDAYSRTSELLYSGGFTVDVRGGVENDVGLVELDPLAPLPPPPLGSVGMFWSFLYPSSTPQLDCAIAGVVDIDVLLVSEDGEEVRDTFDCEQSAGATFDNLLAGGWTLHLDAYGRYHGDDVHLYGVSIDVDVDGDATTELGEIALPRDDEGFGDLEVDWNFTGATCATAGVETLTISVQRAGLAAPEDVVDVDCGALSAVRTTFVPGSYTVVVDGAGSDGDYRGVATVDLAPNSTGLVGINLARQ